MSKNMYIYNTKQSPKWFQMCKSATKQWSLGGV